MQLENYVLTLACLAIKRFLQDNGTCLTAQQAAIGFWDVSPDCDDITVPVIGAISLNDPIPENIEVDLANLEIGASIKISSVKLPQNANPTITDRDFVVATIAAPTIVKEPEKPAEETPAEGVEGEAAPTADGAETAASGKEGDAPKKEEKGKETAGDKKPAAKPAAEKKQEKK